MPVGNYDFPRSAYLHIPFCRRRCYYCDFPVFVLGDHKNGQNSGTICQYVEILCQEIRQSPPSGIPLETIFFGGGTPSLLSVAQLEQLLHTLDQQFGIATTAEISLEMDPGTFDLSQVQGYRQAGVNRISLGVQAFQDSLLQQCGRTHQVSDIYTAVEQVRQAGIENLSLDLISGLPHQTLTDWQTSLEAAIALQPTHLSCYDLIVEPGTAFARSYEPGQTPLPPDEIAAQMYRQAQITLTQAGYQHYEISNYSWPGFECRHNRVYWEMGLYYGWGMGAASYTQNTRFTRPRKTQEYYQWVQSGCPIDQPSLTCRDRLLETLMLGLRLSDGIHLQRIIQEFGIAPVAKIWQGVSSYYQQGWVEILDPGGLSQFQLSKLPLDSCLRLQDPEGFLMSNRILASLFEQFEV